MNELEQIISIGFALQVLQIIFVIVLMINTFTIITMIKHLFELTYEVKREIKKEGN